MSETSELSAGEKLAAIVLAAIHNGRDGGFDALRWAESFDAALKEAVQVNFPGADDGATPAAPTDPARITYTEEIEQWYREHPLTQLTEDGGSRPLGPLEWAETQTAAMLAADGTWKPDEMLNWQSRAFRRLWLEQGSLRDADFHRAYLVYAYYASRASDHPDWNIPGTAAHTVRRARAAAIEEQREKQGGNPA